MKNGKLWKIILIVVLIMLVILIISIARKYIIMKKLIANCDEHFNKTNFMETYTYVQGDKMSIVKFYYKDGDFLEQYEFYDVKNNLKYLTTSYKKGNDTLGVIQDSENKKVETEVNNRNRSITISDSYGNLNFFEFIMQLLKMQISTDCINSENCYLIKRDDGALKWVDKDTGLTLRFYNGVGVTVWSYEFNTVTDEDIVKPEI